VPRATDPQVSFADWELMQQGMALDPLPAAISELLEQHQPDAARREELSLSSCVESAGSRNRRQRPPISYPN
jgi:hypothetical protein